MNLKEIGLIGIFIFSRVLFINHLPVFFDSPEYIERLLNPSYINALTSGHMPFHAGYIMLFWPISQIAIALNANPSLFVIFMQIMFSAIAIYCFYRFVTIIANGKIAAIAAIIISLTPLYWTMNVSIMAESTYINFFLISLFFVALYAKKKINQKYYLAIGSVSFGLALLTNPLVGLWLPFILSIIFYLKKEKVQFAFLSMGLTVGLAILINSFLIAYALQISFQNGIHQYLFGVDIKIAPNISSLLAALRFARNAFIPMLQNNTAIVLVLSLISLTKIFNKNKKLFIAVFLWILPAVFTHQWFDPLLFGRHGSIAVFGFAFLSAVLLIKRKILLMITIVYLLAVSLPALNLLRQPIPYIEMSKLAEKLPKGLLIETHLARPQVEGHYSGEITYINQPGWSPEKLTNLIDNYLNSKKPIYITSQALSEPYGTYSGPFLYPLSLSYAKSFELENIISSYSLERYQAINNAEIVIYKIISRDKSKYPDIQNLNKSNRRMGHYDPIGQLLFFTERAMIIQSQKIIKG